jgi:CheY-like chemotaxis protein
VVTVEEDQAEYAKISFVVKDSGIGIAKEMHQKIFESFSQENPDTTRIYGGTGLGLAITRRILEKLDSFITLESEKGEGATFSFALLFEKATAQNRISEKAQQMSTLEGMRILLVEDNKMNITVMERFMKRWNASLDVAEDGHMAVEKTLEKTYDLILMDLHMPGMDGYQTTAAIRKTHAGLPIFALTADAFSETRDRVMAAGMNDFITKPFDPKELFNKAAQIRAKSLKS